MINNVNITTYGCVIIQEASPIASSLRDSLLRGYHGSVMPTQYPNVTSVKVGAALVRIQSFDETNAIATFNLWLRLVSFHSFVVLNYD